MDAVTFLAAFIIFRSPSGILPHSTGWLLPPRIDRFNVYRIPVGDPKVSGTPRNNMYVGSFTPDGDL